MDITPNNSSNTVSNQQPHDNECSADEHDPYCIGWVQVIEFSEIDVFARVSIKRCQVCNADHIGLDER